jgi:hypothetical protein
MGSYDEPVYDPLGNRGPTHYHPANDVTKRLVALQLILRDIWTLRKIRARSRDAYEKALICKYVIIELVSMDEHLSSLVQQVLSGKVGYDLDNAQFTETKRLYKECKSARKHMWPELKTVRNRLSAHRDILDLLTVSKFWDQVDVQAINRDVMARFFQRGDHFFERVSLILARRNITPANSPRIWPEVNVQFWNSHVDSLFVMQVDLNGSVSAIAAPFSARSLHLRRLVGGATPR